MMEILIPLIPILLQYVVAILIGILLIEISKQKPSDQEPPITLIRRVPPKPPAPPSAAAVDPSRSQQSSHISRQTEAELVRLTGNRDTALRLVSSTQSNNLTRSAQWCWEKAIHDLERDRH